MEYGRVARGWAEIAEHRGHDPLPYLETATTQFARAKDLKSSAHEAHLGWAESLVRRAEISAQRAQNTYALDAAHEAVDRARLEMADPTDLFDLSQRLDRLTVKSTIDR